MLETLWLNLIAFSREWRTIFKTASDYGISRREKGVWI